MTHFYAHTYPGDTTKTRWQAMKTHALNVAALARAFAEPFGEGERAERAGKLHDLGKYGSLFQKRLLGQGNGYDHWTIGACCANAAQGFNDPGLALAIQGHHIGLQQGDEETLRGLTPQAVKERGELQLTEPEPHDTSFGILVKRLIADGVPLARPAPPPRPVRDTAGAMLDTRMLFSALVDADYLDTEEAMRPDDRAPRAAKPPLDAAQALAALEHHVHLLRSRSDLPPETRDLRADLMKACKRAGQRPERQWTLTAPTGSGKTLAMLLFALTRAGRMQTTGRPLRRIVVALPFLSILDQTADTYRRIFTAAGYPPEFILEHHSLTGTHESGNTSGTLSDNWDAPIVVTTSVQLLESLHASHPGTCRKLHRLAHSVILMDEVQTLPTALAATTLKTLARLTDEKYGTVVVMATATQPAFDTLLAQTMERGGEGWNPREMADPALNLFARAKRVDVQWNTNAPTRWTDVQQQIREQPQTLCIVNMRQHAHDLAKALEGQPGLRHLSTSLCPAHRRKVLQEIEHDLQNNQPVRVVATQCIEAGVDLDFPTGLRALGPLDAIAQAAGRINRHRNRPTGLLQVFLPEDERYPTDAYQRAAQITALLVRRGEADLDDPETFRKFYAWLWQHEATDSAPLREAILRQDYPEVAGLYRLIPRNAVNVIVPYGEGSALIGEVRRRGLDHALMQRAQPYTVSVFRRRDGSVPEILKPVQFQRQNTRTSDLTPDWYLAPDNAYDAHLYGLSVSENPSSSRCPQDAP